MLWGGTEPENDVSAQEEEKELPYDGKEITEDGTYTMPEGPYTGNFVINTEGDVTIEIDGNVNATASGTLWKVKKVHDLTIENDGHTVTYTGTQILLADSDAEANKITVSGGTYQKEQSDGFAFVFNTKCNVEMKDIIVNSYKCAVYAGENFEGSFEITNSTFSASCTDNTATMCFYQGTSATLDHVTATSNSSNALINKGGICTIKGGKYETVNDFSAIANSNGGVMNVYGGEYRMLCQTPDNIMLVNQDNSELNIHGGTFEGGIGVISTSGTGKLNIDEAFSKTVIRGLNGATTAGVVCKGASTADINGCTIEGVKCGIMMQPGTSSLTLQDASFVDNKTDIGLYEDKQVVIEDTFTGEAKVKVTESPIADKRPITKAGTTSQANLNLVSRNKDANGKTYVATYDEAGNYWYLAQRTGYLVDAGDAEVTTEAGTLNKYDQVDAGTTVTVTAQKKQGYRFAGWITTDLALSDEELNQPQLTFGMPGNDVTLTAQYEAAEVDPDDPGSDIGSVGTTIAGIVGAGVLVGATAVGVYEAGTGIYRMANMRGIAMPSDRAGLALLIWEKAGKPQPESTALYADIDEDNTDLQAAAHWMVEQELMDEKEDNNFKPNGYVTKLKVCHTWEMAKQKGMLG